MLPDLKESDANNRRFRWAVCQLDTLGKCRNRLALRKSLASLPPTLDETYDRILSAINEDDSKYAARILRWLTFSSRPLLVEEISEIVAIDVERDPMFDRQEVLEDPLEALNICSSLVTLVASEEFGEEFSDVASGHVSDSATEVIVLAHFSVKEYLISERIRQGRAARYSMQDVSCNEIITKSCLGYLLQFQQQSEPLSEENIQDYKLARYSAEFWTTHAQAAMNETETWSQLAMELLLTENGAYLNWIRIHDIDDAYSGTNFRKTLSTVPAPLYYATRTGLTNVVSLLLENKVDVNAQGGLFGNALEAASRQGHEQVVRMLLDEGADINALGGQFGNALQAASWQGHEQLVRLLLDKDINADVQSGHLNGALLVAAHHGHERVVRLLLGEGADVNAEGGYHGSALQAAAARGHEQVVRLLLDEGADINAQGGHLGNALQAAAIDWRENERLVQLLLDRGADINAQGGYYGNALQAAAARPCKDHVIRLLLQQGADVNVQGGLYGNALQAAAVRGQEQVVQLLLDHGADVNAQGGFFGTALQAASRNDERVVRLLLDNGADVNMQGGYYGTALQAAARDKEQVVRLLLDNGADVNVSGGIYGAALYAAMATNHQPVVQLLLDNGAENHARGEDCDSLELKLTPRRHDVFGI